jgi:hypothetical protein
MMKHDRYMTDLASVQRRARGRMGVARKFEVRVRQDRIKKLVQAICDTHPEDARLILIAALGDLNQHDGCMDERGRRAEDARWWVRHYSFWESMPAVRDLVVKMTGAHHE